ncbi:hypothetical protein AH06_00645 [candidate division TM6 bacterium Zodletone_IIa]|nr:hypothetical protein AH06_00645 [candidate division TM6 bacterium Zodletone_IIa]
MGSGTKIRVQWLVKKSNSQKINYLSFPVCRYPLDDHLPGALGTGHWRTSARWANPFSRYFKQKPGPFSPSGKD